MSRVINVGILAALVALVVGCQHQPRYAYIYDRQTDFSKLKTYDWIEGVQKGTAGRDIGGVPVDKLIIQMVDKELAAKGYTKPPTGATPDFTVRFRSVLEFRAAESASEASPVTGEPELQGTQYEVVSPAPDIQPGVPSSYKVGTLYLTMRDPRMSTVLWRGQAEAVLREQATDEQRRAHLEEAVHKLLGNFPPKIKS